MNRSEVAIIFKVFKGDACVEEKVLRGPVIKIGRMDTAHLFLKDESVSRMHAVVEVNDVDDVRIIDLGSTRGTSVNGTHIMMQPLHSGDEVVFGGVRTTVAFTEVPVEDPTKWFLVYTRFDSTGGWSGSKDRSPQCVQLKATNAQEAVAAAKAVWAAIFKDDPNATSYAFYYGEAKVVSEVALSDTPDHFVRHPV